MLKLKLKKESLKLNHDLFKFSIEFTANQITTKISMHSILLLLWAGPNACTMSVIATNFIWLTAEVLTRDQISFAFCGISFAFSCLIFQSNSCIGWQSWKGKNDDEDRKLGHFGTWLLRCKTMIEYKWLGFIIYIDCQDESQTKNYSFSFWFLDNI